MTIWLVLMYEFSCPPKDVVETLCANFAWTWLNLKSLQFDYGNVRSQSHVSTIWEWCKPLQNAIRTQRNITYFWQAVVSRNLLGGEVGVVFAVHMRTERLCCIVRSTFTLPNVPNFIFERGVGSPKPAENDPSSIEHPFLQSSWMRFFHPTGVTGMEDQDEMMGTVVWPPQKFLGPKEIWCFRSWNLAISIRVQT